MSLPTLYNIPAGVSFADTLAKGLLKEVGDAREKLATYLILLPTRRACRSLQEAFLRQTNGMPILLPRLQPFGDIDAEELFISGQGKNEIDIPPAMAPLKRQILLAHTISKLPNYTKGPAQDIALAQALGQLLDEIHTENLNLKDLDNLVSTADVSEHWQITVKFLKILSEHWPQILRKHGAIDLADRRNRLINALNTHWQETCPEYPIIAAGSTGSIPATAALLKTISLLPNGSVILPGLDQHMTEESWQDVGEGHPQATIKKLVTHLGLDRQDIKNWPYLESYSEEIKTREKFISTMMLPPEKTDDWQKTHYTAGDIETIKNNLHKVTRYDCETPQEEAQLIALLLREILENKNKTAALITPDRNLARRVTVACHRWDIEIDDSAGQTLSDSQIGSFLRCCAQAAIDNLKPLSLLSLLKHDQCFFQEGGGDFHDFRSEVRALDQQILRGTMPASGFKGLKDRYHQKLNDPKNKQKPNPKTLSFIEQLENLMAPFIDKFSDGFHDFATLLENHVALAEKLSGDKNSLWQHEEGEAAALFLSELNEQAASLPQVTGADYLEILYQFMKDVTIRPRYGTHPRLMILGQLEARLVQADRVILSGLNEGTWPPDAGHDPWMSRPMRKEFGLPAPERGISLAAHDFVQGFCAEEVFLTRAERVNTAPTVPARWLQRLDTFVQAINIDPATLRCGPHKKYLSLIDNNKDVTPIRRPEPRPPINSRPRKLSVTKIEKWMKDPYAIYAEKILNLYKLDPIDKSPDAADKGTIMHQIMEDFTTAYPKNIPEEAADNFIRIARDVLEENTSDLSQWNFWLPRMIQLSDWLIPHEKKWRETAQFKKAEAEGLSTFSEGLDTPFTLTARADRIDIFQDGSVAIIDYKSGGEYTKSRIKSGDLPQLPLEAIIMSEGGFSNDGIPQKEIGSISYWKLTGGRKAGEITELNKTEDLQEAMENAKAGLLNLIQIFDDAKTPYYAIPKLNNAPRFNDYEYLERVKEWAALGENNEEAA